VRCGRCKGTGQQGGSTNLAVDEQPWPCPDCDGEGLACPTCRDMRWLRSTAGPVGNRPLVRCPDCATPEARWAAIARYMQAALGPLAAGPT
jgi:hypothetical protein